VQGKQEQQDAIGNKQHHLILAGIFPLNPTHTWLRFTL
jgi:hypothetical protein